MLPESLDFAADAPSIDPLADLLFTLIAAILPAILLLAPLTDEAGKASRRNIARAFATLHGHPVVPIVASADGIRIEGRLIELDQISSDTNLSTRLERMRRDSDQILLLVEPGGIESAFLFDPIAAAHGLAHFDEIRSPVACHAAEDDALKTLCGPPA